MSDPNVSKAGVATVAPGPPSSVMQFPFLDLKAQFAEIKSEIMTAVERVLESQRFILGAEVEALEAEVCDYMGCKFAIACASGSDALLLALMTLGTDVGDEVITTPFTFVATAGAIARLKARPVFVDIDKDTFNLDPAHLAAAITKRTRAIIPVHLFGLAADMKEIGLIAAKHRIPVVEDAAQAIGASWETKRAGTIGTIGCFSFFPSKNLGGAGDGGMLTTNHAQLADRLKILRVHGSRRKYAYEVLGINSRLDELQAAVLRVKLRHLDDWNARRRDHASRYRNLFHQAQLEMWVKVPAEPARREHVYNQFVIRVPQRDALRNFLTASGIPTEIYYPAPLHLQLAFAYLGHRAENFHEAERASREVLALPIYPELTPAQDAAVVDAIAEFYHAKRKF
jgi:dTDP-4-amino-4,6-dideoxygalactose transaminase